MEYTKKAIVDYHTQESAQAHFNQTVDEWHNWYFNEFNNDQADNHLIFLPYTYTSPTVAEVLLKDMPQVERFIAHHQVLVEKIGYPVSVSVVDFDSTTENFTILDEYPPIE